MELNKAHVARLTHAGSTQMILALKINLATLLYKPMYYGHKKQNLYLKLTPKAIVS
jgi:hypothetical protein